MSLYLVSCHTLGVSVNNRFLIGNKKPAGGLPVVTKDELRDIRDKTEKGQKADAIIISKGDLDRMRAATKIQTKDQ